MNFTFRSSRPQSNDKFHDQDFKEIAVAMDMTDNDVSMEISTLPNFSLGFDFLWEVNSTNSSEEGRNSAKDNSVTFLKQRNENCSGSINRNNGAGFPNFTKITQHSRQNSETSCQGLRDRETENKVNVEQMSCPASKSTVAPRKVTNSSISSGSSVVSDQRHAFNNSLMTQNKSSPHSDSQRSDANAHAKLQVVTPSCRPSNVGTRPAISPLLTVRIKSLL